MTNNVKVVDSDQFREKLIDVCKQANDELRLRTGCSTWGDFADILIANGVTVQEWISVKDRLPEEDKKILLLCKNGAMFVGVLGRYYGGTESRFKICTALASTKLLNKGRVTHWMPLPEPPKGE